MCARWIQLAQFYPLARNNQNLTFNGKDSDFSEPYTLEGKYKDWAKKAIRERYRYLRQLYTCLYEVNQNGGTCFDPLFYHFPQDDNVYQDYQSTFIYANGIKVSPILHALADNETSFKVYFPKGKWVSLNNFASIVDSAGEMKDLPVDNALAHAHIMPGAVVA
jgi:alpha-glucosidase